MRIIGVFILTIIISYNLSGQSCEQEEIEIKYSNAFEVFNVCKSNPVMEFDEKKEYYWYTEFSNIKSTKGGCGGKLLNGNYKFYDELGNLIIDRNYLLGLADGSHINWDSLGNIISKFRYKSGDVIYYKFLNEQDYWIEIIGPIFREGTVRKTYTKYGVLIGEEKNIADYKLHVKRYYENYPNQLSAEYTKSRSIDDYYHGKYISYYENGEVEVEGQYSEIEFTNIRVGLWKWYNKDGSLDTENNYKAEILYWPNGEMKIKGGFVFDTDSNEWVKSGEWKRYDEDGKFIEKKEYQWGVEINE